MSNTTGVVFAAESLRDAKVALRAASYDAALELLTGCEDWPAEYAEQAVVIKAETMGRRDPVGAVAYLQQVADLVSSPAGRFAFAVQSGKAYATVRGFSQAESRYEEARALMHAVPDGAATIAYHDLRMRWFRRECDPGAPEVQLAVAHPDPSIASAAYAYRAWLHAGNENYAAHVADLRRAVAYANAPTPEPVDVATLATSIHSLAQVGFETADGDAIAAARDAARALAWTPDVARYQYLTVRALGWDSFMRGRAGEAQWAFKDARMIAPSVTWRVMAHLDRAYVARLSRNEFWAAEELAQADALAYDIDWAATHGEDRQILVMFAVLHAPADAPRAQRYASMYSRFGTENLDPSLAVHQDRRAKAHELYALGRIEQTMGRTDAAIVALQRAYAVFDAAAFHYRAALTASALAELGAGDRWHEAGLTHAGYYPECPLSAMGRPSSSGEDGMPAQLSPVQAQIARSLCGGADAAELSRRFSRSQFTIENHIKVVMRAFGVETRAALLDEARRRGLA